MDNLATQNKEHTPITAEAVKGEKRRGGRPKASSENLKKNRVFKMNDKDFEQIKALAALGKKSPSEIVRRSIKGLKIYTAPDVANTQCWSNLSRALSNLNQIAFRLNYISKGGKEEGAVTDKELKGTIEDVKVEVVRLRAEIKDVIR